VFGLTMAGLTADQRSALWDRVYEIWTTKNFLSELPSLPPGIGRRGGRRRREGSR
jgi:hypothetical protein